MATFVGWRLRGWPLWAEMGWNLCWRHFSSGLNPLRFARGAHHVCNTLVKRKKLGPVLRPVLAALVQSEPEIAVPPAAYTALSRLRELS